MFRVVFPGGSVRAKAGGKLIMDFRKFRGDKSNGMNQDEVKVGEEGERAKRASLLEDEQTSHN